jgi:hypothetical protein
MTVSETMTDAAAAVDQGSAPARAEWPSMTVVTCVESGPLEPMVLRMVESLRQWGGRFRDSPVLAVSPRFGPPLARSTRRAFDSLGVSYRPIRPVNAYSWMDFYNKPLAVDAAETEATTELVAFLDADILIVGEPEQMALAGVEDFAASATNKTVGSAGPGDEHEPYWEAVCAAVGLRPDDLPWVTTCEEGLSIRAYWQGGVFVYRRTCGYGRQYLDACARLIDSRVISHSSRSFFTEQVSLSLAMARSGLRWRALPLSHNYNVLGAHLAQADPELFRQARVLHYHDAMWPASWPAFLRLCESARPDVHAWLERLGPLANPSALPCKVLSRALRHARARRLEAFEAACRSF